MPLWLVVVGLLMLASIIEIFLALRLDLAPAARTILIASAVVTPLFVLALFRFVIPETGAILIL
jgi:hypothetical protein